ncbi:hypothetical protein C8R43DRAFT_1242033 [Mycena crocata]|nr:hypothetical protein C8R43DRAFT_1242033 [Mycena crocata]
MCRDTCVTTSVLYYADTSAQSGMSSPPNQTGRGQDSNNRAAPIRIDRKRFNASNHQGPFRPHEKASWPPPEGKHTRFTDVDVDATSRKRSRSQEPTRKGRGGDTHVQRKETEPDTKRAKLHEESSRSHNQETSRLTHSPSPELDELILVSSRSPTPTSPSSPITVENISPPISQAKKDRPLGLFSRAIGSLGLISDNEARSRKSKELQDAQEAATQYQAELIYAQCLLKELQDERNSLKLALQESQQNVPNRELEAAKEQLQELKLELKERREEVLKLHSTCQRIHGKNKELVQTAAKNERRIDGLIAENVSLSGQLKMHRTEIKGKSGPIDVFDHRLDQVSEARVKSGVESLNDSLDNLIMDVIEKGEELATTHADLVLDSPHREYPDSALFRSLAQHHLTSENRGLLLDAILHDNLQSELFDLFFSGDIASTRIDPSGFLQTIFNELTQREPWTVSQRWRGIAATSVFTLFDERHIADSVAQHVDGVITLLAWAFGLSPPEFEGMANMIRSGLLVLHKEAHELSILLRRDIVSVRMSITSLDSLDALVFDPKYVNSVWPEMGTREGDEVVGRYKFGLSKMLDSGQSFCLIKPEVTTAALIRMTANNG